jgi:eukaryotic-like serine/threonine-protein kinase
MTDGASPVHDNTRAQSQTDVLRQTPPPLFQPGDHLPNLEMWTLQRRIGGGGFGEVWLVNHPGKGKAAVKFCTDPAARHKLVTHEKTVVARVMKHCGDHPNVVPLLECNLSGEIPWLMYEYVEGGTLADALDSWRNLTPPRRLGKAVLTLHAIAGALGTFHQLAPPLVHRDMKPQNVLMAGTVPRITDFGVGGAAMEAAYSDGPMPDSSLAVRMPTLLQTVGSSKYAPQEQMLGAAPNPRDDVYALGIIAYQLVLADLRALPGDNAERELRAMRIPAELASLIVRSTALDPQRRPRDATEWERKLAELVRKKTASRAPAPKRAAPKDEPTELLASLSDSEIAESAPTQTITVAARGRWYARVASGRLVADWHLVTTTPTEVRVAPGEVYRFSIHSAATQADVNAIGDLAGLTTLRYLNLSFCNGVTDAGLARVAAFANLRQLFLRGCHNVTDAGLAHLRALTHLHSLELTDCTGLSDEGVAALQEALPNCKIAR